jgi:hypothetical protein
MDDAKQPHNTLTLSEKIKIVDLLRALDQETIARCNVPMLVEKVISEVPRATVHNVGSIAKELGIITQRARKISKPANHHARQAKLAQAVRYIAKHLAIELPEYIDEPLKQLAGKIRLESEDRSLLGEADQ